MRLLALCSCAALLSPSPPFITLNPPGEEVRLTRSAQGLPVVAVHAGAELLRLGLDTGTSRTLISASAATRLGLLPRQRLIVTSAAGQPQTGFCGSAPDLRVAGLPLTPDCLGWLPGEPVVAGAEDLDGILGSDLLAQVDLWIDLRSAPVRARFAPAGSLAPWVDGTPLPLQAIGRRRAIICKVESLRQHRTARLVIDSAADSLVLFGDVARRTATAAVQERTHGTLIAATARRGVAIVPILGVRSGRSFFAVTRTGVLPDVNGRDEDGLIPLDTFGPVLLDPANRMMVANARIRSAPRDRRQPM